MFFHETRHFLRVFAEKFVKTPKHGSFFEKLEALAKSMLVRVFSLNERLFPFFLLKSSSKRRNVVVSSKSCKF